MYPEKSGVIAPVPGAGVEHVWCENTTDYTNDVATRKSVQQLIALRAHLLKVSS
jgi:hypothetical protein